MRYKGIEYSILKTSKRVLLTLHPPNTLGHHAMEQGIPAIQLFNPEKGMLHDLDWNDGHPVVYFWYDPDTEEEVVTEDILPIIDHCLELMGIEEWKEGE